MMTEQHLNIVMTELSRRHGITCGPSLGLGNVVQTVFRARQGSQKLVVKIGVSPRAKKEIAMNWTGYQNMRNIGAQKLLPEPLQRIHIKGTPVIVMGDCGKDFWHAVQRTKNPGRLYRYLISQMMPIYESTLCVPEKIYFKSLQNRLLHQYQEHLKNLVDAKLVERLKKSSLNGFKPVSMCFASFDFTPEDVFVSRKQIKYADPLEDVIGIPIIDLACFAGVARDVYGLPGSKKGYRVLESAALNRLPLVLGLSKKEAKRLFVFGRALQSALSARFRITTDTVAAAKHVRQSQMFLKMFLDGV